jgi:hypothetical protein
MKTRINRSKFNVDKDKSKRSYNGIVFDSVLEMKYYRDVILPSVENGDITHYELQKSYELQPKFHKNNKTVKAITYIADFYVEYSDGTSKVIDIKGMPDNVAKLKRKLFWYKYPDIDYVWITYSKCDGGWIEYETLKKLRQLRKKVK